MKRSDGVTAAAIVLLSGSAIGLLFAAVGVDTGLTSTSRFFAGWKSYSSAIVLLVWSLWWMITGIGILRLRSWARVSILTLSAAIIFFQAQDIAITLLMPPRHSPYLMTYYVSSLVSSIPFACSIWWLVLFARDSVGRQFVPAAELPAGVSAVGAFLLTSALLAAILSFAEYMTYRIVTLKIFGWIVIGAHAWICYAFWGVLSLVVGSGLLLGKRWAHRAATVCVLVYVLFGLSTIRSGRAAYEFLISHGYWNHVRHDAGWLALFDTAWDLAFGGVALYLLWSRREAFARPQSVSGAAEESNEGGTA